MPDTPKEGAILSMSKEEAIAKMLKIQSFYSNGSNLAFGIYDFRVTFVDQIAFEGVGTVTRQAVEIVMSPEHMKDFAMVMMEKIAEYEKAFGPIPRAENEKENASPQG